MIINCNKQKVNGAWMSAQFAWFIGLLLFLSIWTFSAVVAAASVDKLSNEKLRGCNDGHLPNVVDLTPGSESGNYCYGE